MSNELNEAASAGVSSVKEPQSVPIEEYRRLQAYATQLEKYHEEMEVRLTAYNSMQEVSPEVETIPGIEDTLKQLVNKVGMIMQAEKCVFMLPDEKETQLVAQKPAKGIGDKELRLFRVDPNHGVGGKVFREGVPIMVNDALHDPLWDANLANMLGVRSSLSMPLLLRKGPSDPPQIIGILHVFNKSYNEEFNDEDIQILSTLARQASVIIQNTKTFIALMARKTELETTLLSMLTGVLVLDRFGRILFCNPKAKEILNVQVSDPRNLRATDAIKELKVLDLLNRSIREREVINDELTLNPRSSQEMTFQFNIVPEPETSSTDVGVVASFTDITRIKRLEQLKTEFVSTASHELRTPLTSIKGFISTLLDDEEGSFDQESRMEFYNIIDEECDRLIRLISDLLTISRIEGGRSLDLKMAPMQIPPVVKRSLQAIKSSSTMHEFALAMEDNLPTIIADKDKVDQILVNLLGNAVKYSPEGGTVTLRVYANHHEVHFSVKDQGVGIPEEHLDKIFDKFHRVNTEDTRMTEGAGIGLFIVKNLVESHKGRIWVESQPGFGSTFNFTLPIKHEIAESNEVEASS